MTNEEQQDVVRQQVLKNNAEIMRVLAPLYLGKFCPLIKDECRGPACGFFLPTGDENKITGGECSIPLLASQAGPIADGLVQLALAKGPLDPNRVIPPTGAVIR